MVILCTLFCRSVNRSPLASFTHNKSETEIRFHHFPALPASISNLSGAGDCLVAGTMVALSANEDVSTALAFGVAASKWAVEADVNVSPNLDYRLVSGKSFSFSFVCKI